MIAKILEHTPNGGFMPRNVKTQRRLSSTKNMAMSAFAREEIKSENN